MTIERYRKSSSKERIQYLTMRHPLTILFGYFTVFIFGMCIVPMMDNIKAHRDSLWAIIIHILLYTVMLLTVGLVNAFFALFLPLFIAGAIGSYLFYVQHNFPQVTFIEKEGWSYEGAALESSSFCKMGAFMNYMTANIGYHHIHHLNSKIPFYRLPEVYAKMPELQNSRSTSLNPMEIIRCLSLKIWDVEKQKLVSLKEAAV